MLLDVHVVTHTHWDREWYHPLERFRQRLVALVDELIDDPPSPGESFLLDGQAIIIEDYLEVRPERADVLRELLRDARLEAGPWYVLADELIPSGEALVRNLLAGRRVLWRFGAAFPPVLYLSGFIRASRCAPGDRCRIWFARDRSVARLRRTSMAVWRHSALAGVEW